MNRAASRPSASPVQSESPRILLFGDSHSHAVQRAIEKRTGKGKPVHITAFRLAKLKNGKKLGDMALEEFLKLAAELSPRDVVLSMIGGNQHAVFSTIQHPQAYDFFAPEGAAPDGQTEIIPYRVVADVFEHGLRKGDGKSLEALREATRAHVIHVIPPPPKADNAFIEQNHETLFAQNNLEEHGVSPPALRMKYWKLQTRILAQICEELRIEVMMPPSVTVGTDGFLRPEFYAQDATHANYQYGEKLMREVERRFVRPAGEQTN